MSPSTIQFGALTVVGLLFLYARRMVDRPMLENSGWLVRALPVVNALVITCWPFWPFGVLPKFGPSNIYWVSRHIDCH